MIVYPYKGFNPENFGASNRVGTFPIGSAFTWHGGMHLETTSDIMVIADGEIVAYRLASDYTAEEIEGERTAYYSNCCVLVKHVHEFDDKKFIYFSLYNHLWPVSEMKTFVSEVFQKCEYEIPKGDDTSGQFGIYGVNELFGRSYDSVFVAYDAELKVLNKGQTTFIDKKIKVPLAPSKGEYYTVEFNSEGNWRSTNPAFYVAKDLVVVQGEGEDMVATVKPKPLLKDYAFKADTSGLKGVYQYKKAGDANSVKDIMGVLAKGKNVELSGKPKTGNWYKVLDQGDGKEGGYIQIGRNEERKVSCRFDQKNMMVNCSIPVKAGTLLGKGGMYGYEMNTEYRACHFEIFSDNEVEAFLKHDSDKLKDYLSLPADTSFGTVLSVPKIPKGYPLEVIETKGLYSKVKVPHLKKLVPYEYLGIYSDDDECHALQGETDQSYVAQNPGTEIVEITKPDLPQANLAGLKAFFGDFLTADHRLKLIKKVQEQREVSFEHAMAGKEMWIRTHKIEAPTERIEGLGISSVQVKSSHPETPPQPSLIISVRE